MFFAQNLGLVVNCAMFSWIMIQVFLLHAAGTLDLLLSLAARSSARLHSDFARWQFFISQFPPTRSTSAARFM